MFFFEKKLNDLTRKTQCKTNAYLPSLGRPTFNCKNKLQKLQSGQVTLLICQQALHFEKRARRAANVMREREGKPPGRVADLSRHHPNEDQRLFEAHCLIGIPEINWKFNCPRIGGLS